MIIFLSMQMFHQKQQYLILVVLKFMQYIEKFNDYIVIDINTNSSIELNRIENKINDYIS